MRSIFKILIALLLLTNLFSCEKLNNASDGLTNKIIEFNSKFGNEPKKGAVKSQVATSSVIEEEDTRDNLKVLTGDVQTLSKYPLPKIGDTIAGFQVKAIYDYDEKNAKVVSLEHLKTGTNAMIISNDDEDKEFSFAFKTLPKDDKGIPHVFEHASLSGSKKYPNPNLFFTLMNKSYITDANASTSQNYTLYYTSSLDDRQLFSMYNFYLDGVFNPIVLTDKRSLDREGYRYELTDKDADLDVTGVVYSEMLGASSNITRKHTYDYLKTLYPNSNCSYDTGGIPEDIITMTQEEIIEFHEKYYHPSNMFLTLYGDIDYEKYLSYVDSEYISKYDRKEIILDDPDYVKNGGFVSENKYFPVTEDTSIDKGSLYTYVVSCEGMTPYEAGAFGLVLNALEELDGPIGKRLLEKLPEAKFAIYTTLVSSKPHFTIDYDNVDEKDGEILKTITEEAFKELLENGIEKETLEAVTDRISMSNELSKDSHGFKYIQLLDYYEAHCAEDGVLSYFKFNKGLKDTEKRYNDGTIMNLAKKYLSDNSASVLVGTIPKQGLSEEVQNNRKEFLKNKKDNMSDKEKEDLIKSTKEFAAWADKNKSEVNIDNLRVASVSSLKDTKDKCYVYEENNQGIRFLRSDIENIHYNNFTLLFDTSNVKYEDLHKLSLLEELLLQLPTENYDDLTLASTLSKYAYTYGYGQYINKYWNGGIKPYFCFDITCLDKNTDKVFELLKELLFKTKFEDVEKVRSIVGSTIAKIKSNANSNPQGLGYDYMYRSTLEDYKYDNYTKGYHYLRFLNEVENMSDEELQKLLSECKELLYSIYNKDGMVCEIVSNFKTMKEIKNKVINLADEFKEEKVVSENYDDKLPTCAKNIAIVVNSDVQYNFTAVSMREKNIEYSSRGRVIDALVSEKILYPELRVNRSVYSSFAGTNRTYCYVETYRDPSLSGTFAFFKQMPSLFDKINITEDDLEDYKLKAYSKLSYPLTKMEQANTAIEETLNKCDEVYHKRYSRYMKDIKATNMSNIATYSNALKTALSEGNRICVGKKEQIEESKDLFDEIIYDYVK